MDVGRRSARLFALLNGRDDVGLANDELLRGCEYEKRKMCRKARASDLGL